MKNKTIIALIRIEIIILLLGNLVLGIANYFITKDELKLIRERQDKYKIKTVYKDCLYDEESMDRKELKK